MVQNNKKLCQASYLRNHSSCDWHLWHTFIKWRYTSRCCFLFFKSLFCRVVRWIKKQKNGPKWDQILSVALHISGTIHHMIFISGTHVWNNISRHFFCFFKILIFWVIRKVKGKKWPKMTKDSICLVWYPRNHTSYDLHLCYTCIKG